MSDRVVILPLAKAEKLLALLDEYERELRHKMNATLSDFERAQQLEVLRQDLELAIVRSPR